MKRLTGLAFLALSGCATLGQPAPDIVAPGNEAGSFTVAYDPSQSPGRMTAEEAQDLLLAGEKPFVSTLCSGPRDSQFRLQSKEIYWSFVMGKGQGLRNGLNFPYDRIDPRVRQYPPGTVLGAPFKINTGTDVTALNTDEAFAHSGLVPFMLNFQTLEEAKPFSEALCILKNLAAGKEVYVLRDRGAAAFEDGRLADAKADAELYLKHNLRLAAAFEGQDPLGAMDLKARRAATGEAMAKAEKAEKGGDLDAAFREYRRAYGLATETGDFPVLEAHLSRLLPKLRSKPAISETCRRQIVKGQTLSDAKRYVEAMDAFSLATHADPWCPDVYFNMALLLGDAPPGVWDAGAGPQAIEYMKRYLALAPDAPDARTAQDKIYAWEALGGK